MKERKKGYTEQDSEILEHRCTCLHEIGNEPVSTSLRV